MFVSNAAASPARREGASPARWMRVAAGRIGVLEDVRKKQGEVAVHRYLESAGFAPAEGEPWSAVFVRWVLEQVGYAATRQLDTRAWLGWGERTSARYGALAIFADSDADGPGHVGFYVGESRNCVYVLGGNTWARGRYAPSVGIRAYNKTRLLGYRWPAKAGRARWQRAAFRLRLPSGVRLSARSSSARPNRLVFGSTGVGLREQLAQAGDSARVSLREQLAQVRERASQALLGVFRQLV